MPSMDTNTTTGDRPVMAVNPTPVSRTSVSVPGESPAIVNNGPLQNFLRQVSTVLPNQVAAQQAEVSSVHSNQGAGSFIPVKIKTEPGEPSETSTTSSEEGAAPFFIPIKIKTEPGEPSSEASTVSKEGAAPFVIPIKIKTEPGEPSEAATSTKTSNQPPGTSTPGHSNSSPLDPKKEPGPATVIWNEVELDNASSLPEKLRRYTPMPRHGHKAVAIDHYMIVFGGGNEGIFGEVNVFDTKLQEWFKPLVQGEKPPGRAAFGMTIHEKQRKLFVCGGMLEYGNYSNDLYELNLATWVWRQLLPESCSKPCIRIGHTFTRVGDKMFLFGGLTNISGDPHTNVPQYLNDLHAFDPIRNQPHGTWTELLTFGSSPTPRESHSAVAYSSRDGRFNKLIVFGGMCGCRLGDLYVFDIDTYMWSKMGNMPHSPCPRSLHSACLIGQRMYVFGGWIETGLVEQEHSNRHKVPKYDRWKCTNDLACLDVESMTWTRIHYLNKELQGTVDLPDPRAGHSTAVVNNRMYVWSGRDGYKRSVFHAKDTGLLQICCTDLWVLDVPVSYAPTKLKRSPNQGTRTNCVTLAWEPVPGVNSYIVQVMRCPAENIPTPAPAAAPNAIMNPIHPPITQPTQQLQGIRVPTNPQASSMMRFQQMKFPLSLPQPTHRPQMAPLMQNQRMNHPSSSDPKSTQLLGLGLRPQSLTGAMQIKPMGLPSSPETISIPLQRGRFPQSSHPSASGMPLQPISLPPSSGIPLQLMSLPPSSHSYGMPHQRVSSHSSGMPLQRMRLQHPSSHATGVQLHRMNLLPPSSQATSGQLQRMSLLPPPSQRPSTSGQLQRMSLLPPPSSQATSTSMQLQRMSLQSLPPRSSVQVQRFSRLSTSQTASTQLQLVNLPKAQGTASMQLQQIRFQQTSTSIQFPPQFRRVGPSSSSQPISMTQLQAVRLPPAADGKVYYYILGNHPQAPRGVAPPRPAPPRP